jgi:glycosyltransferase involved in cell wall biosynthesis
VRVFFQAPRYPRWPGATPRSYLYAEIGADYRLEGIDVEGFEYPALPVLSRAFNGWVSSLALAPRVKAFAPDLVLAYWVYPDGDAALRVARRLGRPCVVGALGSDIHLRSGLNHRLTRRTIRRVDALLTVSEAMRRTAIDEFGADAGRVHTIVNGFDTAVFRIGDRAEERRALAIAPDAELMVYVGRFVQAKGLAELLDAFVRLAPRRPRLRLALIGDGVWSAQLRQRVRDSGLAGRIDLPGGMAPEAVARWLCGRPVVATDVGGTREIVDADNGILVPPRDVDALVAGLAQALNRSWDAAAIAAAMQRSWDDVAVETLDVCRQVVEAASGRVRQPR